MASRADPASSAGRRPLQGNQAQGREADPKPQVFNDAKGRRYEVRARLAVGGMGEVFLASGEAGQSVVIKVLLPHLARDPEMRAALAHEGALGQTLRHPNLVAVLGAGESEQGPFLVLEHVDGVTLEEAMSRADPPGKQDFAATCVVASELLAALDHVHSARGEDGAPLGIVHRDVSPDNVLVDRSGTVKLADLGIARSRLRTHRTRTGELRGKAAYLSPEQATGSEVDARADLYATGALLFELVTGRRYAVGDTDIEVIRHLEDPVFVAPSEVGGDARWDALLRRALARFPEDRFPSARAMRREAERLAATQAPSNEGDPLILGRERLRDTVLALLGPAAPPREEHAIQSTSKRMSRARMVGIAAAVAIAAAASVATWLSWNKAPPASGGSVSAGAAGAAAPAGSSALVAATGSLDAPQLPASDVPLTPLATASLPSVAGSTGTFAERPSPMAPSRTGPLASAPSTAPLPPPAETAWTQTTSVPALLTASAPVIATRDARKAAEAHITSVSAALRSAKARGHDVRALEERAALALQAFLDGRYEDTERELSWIEARLPK